LTVLGEAMKRLAPRLGAATAADLARQYPNIAHRSAFDGILFAIGQKEVTFPTIRSDKVDFAARYGMPPAAAAPGAQDTAESSGEQGTTGSQGARSSGKKAAAAPIESPKSVKATLARFRPLGDRQKVVTLRDEAKHLDLRYNPIAFCFLLRSMFEISAKAYCDDNKAISGLSYKKTDGTDRALVEVLRGITKHLTQNSTDKEMKKLLHGAITELARKDGILSITSMNQLIHSLVFSISTSTVCVGFSNVFPLLKAMNE